MRWKKMTDIQEKMWDALVGMSGEDVARAFTNFFGNQLLSNDFHKFLIDEGYMASEEGWVG
jgi:hypothetical protein